MCIGIITQRFLMKLYTTFNHIKRSILGIIFLTILTSHSQSEPPILQKSCGQYPPICELITLQNSMPLTISPVLEAIATYARSQGYYLAYVEAYLASCSNSETSACITLLIQAMEQAAGFMNLLNYTINPQQWSDDAFYYPDCCGQDSSICYNTCPVL